MSGAGVRIENGLCMVRVSGPDKVALFRELAPCPCVAPKSRATDELRASFREALMEPPVAWPLCDLHGLRVALAACACRGPQPGDQDSARGRLSAALGKLRT